MKKYDPAIHHRHSIRLKGYDYSQAGLYFVTMNTQNRLRLFGKIRDGVMILSPAGEMVQQVWQEIPQFYKKFDIHDFVVMPDHFHGILEIKNDESLVGAAPSGSPTIQIKIKESIIGKSEEICHPHLAGVSQDTWGKGQPRGAAQTERAAQKVGDLIARCKSLTTYKYIQGVREDGWPPFEKRLWQRNYYEHIIRTETAYHNISAYIRSNPSRWQEGHEK